MIFSLYQSRRWGIDRAYIKKIIRSIDAVLPKYHRSEISLAVVDDPTIKKLNARYRHKRSVTDVLSFAERDSTRHAGLQTGRYLGEIIIAYPRTQRQARTNKQSVQTEFAQLLVHGFLHLIGHDHYKKSEAQLMRRYELRIRKELDKL
jgi:probable rRNA maturation factor